MTASSPKLVSAYGLYYLNSQPILLRARLIDPQDVPPEQWRASLERLTASGFNAACLPTLYRGTGDRHALLDAAAQAGIVILARDDRRSTGGGPLSLDATVLGGGQEGAIRWPGFSARGKGGSLFAASLAAARAHPLATDTEPLSCWSAPGRLVDIAALVAHGTRALLIDDAAGEIAEHPSALVGFLRFLATYEEELTASVGVQDTAVWLRYAATEHSDSTTGYSAAFDGLQALLRTCGLNSLVLDLEAVDEDQHQNTPLAFFPAGARLDLDSYGKLVVFVLRGGHLVTFPETPRQELDGASFRSTFLWPHAPAAVREVARRGLLGRLSFRRPATLRTTAGDLIPAGAAIAEFPEAGGAYVRYGTGVQRGERRASPVAVHAEVLLRRGNVPAAYRAQVRDGVSTVVGTVPGAAYASERYRAIPRAARLALRRFAVSLVEPAISRVIVPDDDLEVEAVARLSPDGGCLLFLMNRLGRQTGTLRFPQPDVLNVASPFSAEALFSGAGSTASAAEDGALHITIEADDALVVRLR